VKPPTWRWRTAAPASGGGRLGGGQVASLGRGAHDDGDHFGRRALERAAHGACSWRR
jgi:hypothetical protein